ncbi:hypothetical protein JTE90_023006 [Oedothorax gibbosus]|uniref:Uncharacterized protein n=1 Tax=Oedothorax gibbosus TaxID=931172 RepID=A0AAV6U9H5_9ARAC|nr:hypothetical protein JTE90_023006 [Oedothorax gibbosus]
MLTSKNTYRRFPVPPFGLPETVLSGMPQYPAQSIRHGTMSDPESGQDSPDDMISTTTHDRRERLHGRGRNEVATESEK